jgi:hypothetical protein
VGIDHAGKAGVGVGVAGTGWDWDKPARAGDERGRLTDAVSKSADWLAVVLMA